MNEKATTESMETRESTDYTASQNLMDALKETHRHIEQLQRQGVWNREPSLEHAVEYANQLRAQLLALNSHPWSK